MKRYLFFGLTLLSFILVACQPQALEQDRYNADSFIKDKYELNPLGDTVRFTISPVGSWGLNKPSWLKVNRSSGRGLATIILTAEANVTGAPLSGVVELRADGIKQISVSQASPYAYLENNDLKEYRWDQSPLGDPDTQSAFSVVSNLYWRLELPDNLQSHFNLSQYEGFGDAVITASCLDNNVDTLDWVADYQLVSYVDEARTQIVRDIPGIEEDTLSLRQGHYHFLVNNKAQDSAIFDKSDLTMQSFEIDLEEVSGQTPSWSVKESPDWLDVVIADQQHLEIAPNKTNVTKNDRTFSLTLVAEPSGAERVIEVIQEKYKFFFTINGEEQESERKVAVRNAGDTTFSVNFVSSGAWRVASCPSQVQCSPQSGPEGETPITITIPNQNFSRNELMLPVVVESNDPGFLTTTLQETLSLAQGAFRFQIASELDTLPSSVGGERSFRFISSGELKIASLPSWVDGSIEKLGDEEYRVIVRANSDNNSETTPRTGKIQLVCPGHSSELSTEVNVVQMRSLFDLLSESAYTSVVAYDIPSPRYVISLLSSQNWTIDNSRTSNWISVSQSSGDGRTEPVEITCTVATNTGRERSGQVVIRNNSGATKQITFSQDGFIFDTQKVDFKSSVRGDSHQVKVTCYKTANWRIADYPNWISVSPSSGKGDATVTFTVSGNSNSTSERSGTAIIRNDVTDASKTVSFTQPGYRWDVTNADSYSFGAFKGESSSEFTLTAGGNWSIQTPSWLTASTTHGSAGSTYRIRFTTNEDNAPANSERRGSVVIVSEDFSQLNKTISVSQQYYRFSANPQSLSFKRKGGDGTITIESDGQWSASANQSWITISPKSGSSGSTSIKVTCSKTSSNREGTITIKDSKHSSLEIKIKVSQSK